MDYNPNRWRTKLFYVYVAITGVMVLNISPLIVAALVEHRGFSAETAGQIVGLNLLSLATTSLLGFFTLHRWPIRRTLVAGALMATFGHAVSIFSPDPALTLALQATAGLGAGLMIVSCLGILSLFDDPDAIIALSFFGQVASAVLMFQLGPAILSAWSIEGLFIIFALLPVPILLCCRALAERAPRDTAGGGGNFRSLLSMPSITILLGLFLIYASNTALYAYAELIGGSLELADSVIANALSARNLLGMLGAILVAWLGTRYDRAKPLFIGIATMMAGFALFGVARSSEAYVVAVCTLMISLAFCVPYLVGILVELDASGRLASFANSTVFLGAGAGPFLAAVLIAGDAQTLDISMLVIVCSLLLLAVAIGIGLVGWTHRSLMRHARRATGSQLHLEEAEQPT